jgi:hypothetical protein
VFVGITYVLCVLLSLRGVSSLLLTADDTPALVDNRQLDAVRMMCNADVLRTPNQITPRGFIYGQKVSPRSGPLVDYVGTYDGPKKGRDIALFFLFGREQRVMFRKGELLAA